jgi:methionyl-tRNA formyltransferase
MRVLFLGPAGSPALAYLIESGEEVTATADPLDPQTIERDRPELVVSHRYRHIIKPPLLRLVGDHAINLHISYLPWNRGADPNLWSWIEDTPKGVTIHYIDEGVDTGDIIAQREVEFEHGETLASSYARLETEMLRLFVEQWPRIRTGECDRRTQRGEGSMHRVADRQQIEHRLVAGWATPVELLAPT